MREWAQFTSEELSDGKLRLAFSGPMTVDSVGHADTALRVLAGEIGEIDLTAVTEVDTVGAWIVWRIAQGSEAQVTGASDRVSDLFCGVGNFTLPIARRAAQVTGLEGEAGLVTRARANAERNGLSNVEFAVANLEDAAAVAALSLADADKVLLDPPRAGALTLLEGLRFEQCQRLVYVSCSPLTFARDAAVLVARHGFSLIETGILDMFPNTAHVESLSLFVRE